MYRIPGQEPQSGLHQDFELSLGRSICSRPQRGVSRGSEVPAAVDIASLINMGVHQTIMSVSWEHGNGVLNIEAPTSGMKPFGPR